MRPTAWLPRACCIRVNGCAGCGATGLFGCGVGCVARTVCRSMWLPLLSRHDRENVVAQICAETGLDLDTDWSGYGGRIESAYWGRVNDRNDRYFDHDLSVSGLADNLSDEYSEGYF